MKIKSNTLGIIVISVIIGGVFVASAFNIWNTKSNKVPNTYREGQFKGKYDPADIRGSYSFGDIEKSFGVPVEVLAKAFGVEDEDDLSNFQAKNLESIYSSLATEGKEIGTGSIKIFVALYSGLPVDLGGDDYIPKPAVDILFQKGSLTNEQVSYLKSHIVDTSSIEKIENSNESNQQVQNEEEHDENEQSVRGQTTFNEVITWGVSKEKIEEIIGGKIPSSGMTIRDYCTQNGLSFSEVKDKLNNMINSIVEDIS